MYKNQVAALLAGAGGRVSGEEMSRALGVTRAAVWKEMEALRREGWPIESSPRKGYRLAGPPPALSGAYISAQLPPDSLFSGKVLVEVSPDFYRPTDVVNLWGDPTKARKELGWDPAQKTSFEELVNLMVDADMAKVAVERAGEQVKTNLAEYLEKGIVK